MLNPFDDVLPVLLAVELQGDSLIVRFDNDFYKMEFSGNKSITELTLINCEKAREMFALLNELLGDSLMAYEIDNNGVTFAPEFGFAELKIFCQSVKQNTSGYRKTDLKKRCVWLARDYQQLLTKYGEAARHHSRIDNNIKKLVANSTDRWQRKAAFFDTRDSAKAAALRSQIEAYQRILKIIQEPQCS